MDRREIEELIDEARREWLKEDGKGVRAAYWTGRHTALLLWLDNMNEGE